MRANQRVRLAPDATRCEGARGRHVRPPWRRLPCSDHGRAWDYRVHAYVRTGSQHPLAQPQGSTLRSLDGGERQLADINDPIDLRLLEAFDQAIWRLALVSNREEFRNVHSAIFRFAVPRTFSRGQLHRKPPGLRGIAGSSHDRFDRTSLGSQDLMPPASPAMPQYARHRQTLASGHGGQELDQLPPSRPRPCSAGHPHELCRSAGPQRSRIHGLPFGDGRRRRLKQSPVGMSNRG